MAIQNSLKINKIIILYKNFFLFLLFYLFSYYIIGFYIEGDQKHYRLFYENIKNLEFKEGFLFYQAALGSREPVYYLITYLASKFLEKDVYISIVNSILFYISYLTLKKFNPKPWLYFLFFSNFYLYVLAFAGERLKFSVIFFILAFLLDKKLRLAALVVAALSHIQILIIILISPLIKIYDIFRNILINKNIKINKELILLFFTFLCAVYFSIDQIIFKLPYYIENGGLTATIKPLIFMVATAAIAGKKISHALISQGIIVLSAFLLGSERIAVYSFFIFFYYYLLYNKNNTLKYLLSLPFFYFSLTGIIFLYKIIIYGNGFYE